MWGILLFFLFTLKIYGYRRFTYLSHKKMLFTSGSYLGGSFTSEIFISSLFTIFISIFMETLSTFYLSDPANKEIGMKMMQISLVAIGITLVYLAYYHD
jgi:hypothetical protein